ncbi:MAG: T9SS type A sorting domain-containing protein [Bacteroidota bacterium]
MRVFFLIACLAALAPLTQVQPILLDLTEILLGRNAASTSDIDVADFDADAQHDFAPASFAADGRIVTFFENPSRPLGRPPVASSKANGTPPAPPPGPSTLAFGSQQSLGVRIAAFATDVVGADFDRDGDADVIVSSFDADDQSITEFENTGAGGFTIALGSNIGPTDDPTDLQEADIDGDGDLDVIVANGGNDRVRIHENNGRYEFSLRQTLSITGGFTGEVGEGDLDGDGDLDLVTSEPAWYANDGTGTFSNRQAISATEAGRVFAADADGDGDTDVLTIVTGLDDRVTLFVNDGAGRFTERLLTDALSNPNALDVADLDGDGDPDIVVSDNGFEDVIGYFENLGSGTFSTLRPILTDQNAPKDVRAADLDGDGDVDLVAYFEEGNNDQLFTIENLGGGVFSDLAVIDERIDRAGALNVADFDGDGQTDLIVASALQVNWYRNLADGTPPPPPPPSEDTAAPLLSGGISGARFEGTARDDRADDTGLATVVLRDATNLALDVDAFAAGAARTDFTVTLQQRRLQGKGFVVATDVAGNESALWICSDGCPPPDDPPPPPPPGDDTVAPLVTGSIQGSRFVGDATDGGTDASGIASVRLAGDAVNLTLAVDPFAEGAAAVGFTIRLQNPRQPGSGTIEATDVAGNTGTLFVDSQDRNRAAASAASAALPDAPTLDTAYPNPFAETATVRFGLPEAQPVRVAVYGVTGRTIAVLADGVAEAGWHEARLDGTGLPSGVYLVRFEAGGTQSTQKLLRVR